MSVNYAVISTNTAYLSSEFGENIARKWFGDEIVDELPKYIKGKNKGKPKGAVVWQKVIKGGWVRSYDGGYVENRVGASINQTLNEMLSSQYGFSAGKVLYTKGQFDLKKTKTDALEEAI